MGRPYRRGAWGPSKTVRSGYTKVIQPQRHGRGWSLGSPPERGRDPESPRYAFPLAETGRVLRRALSRGLGRWPALGKALTSRFRVIPIA